MNIIISWFLRHYFPTRPIMLILKLNLNIILEGIPMLPTIPNIDDKLPELMKFKS